eukprot:3347264-Amphidinium_carterae.1
MQCEIFPYHVQARYWFILITVENRRDLSNDRRVEGSHSTLSYKAHVSNNREAIDSRSARLVGAPTPPAFLVNGSRGLAP